MGTPWWSQAHISFSNNHVSSQASGLDERFNQTLVNALSNFAQERRESWDEQLVEVVYSYVQHCSTGVNLTHPLRVFRSTEAAVSPSDREIIALHDWGGTCYNCTGAMAMTYVLLKMQTAINDNGLNVNLKLQTERRMSYKLEMARA